MNPSINRRELISIGVAHCAAITGLATLGTMAQSAPIQRDSETGQGEKKLTTIEVEVDRKIFVQDWGPKSGKPLVFIHGFPFSHRIFEYQMLQLAQKGYRAVGLDLCGFGDSDKPWDGCDYDTWRNDIRKVITTLDLQDVTLVGFSMGGAVSAHYAATQTDKRVTKLALLAAAAPIAAPRPEDKQMLDGLIQGALANQPALVHGFIQNAFHTPPEAELTRFLDDLGTKASLRTIVRSLEELRDRNLVAEMGKITVPTLICHGVADKVVPIAAGEAQQQMIQGAKLVRFDSAGHCMMYEEKEKLETELEKFHAA